MADKKRLEDAARGALPWLILLGDFIGCDAIAAIRGAPDGATRIDIAALSAAYTTIVAHRDLIDDAISDRGLRTRNSVVKVCDAICAIVDDDWRPQDEPARKR